MDNIGVGLRDIYDSTKGIPSRGISPPHVSITISNSHSILTPVVSLKSSTLALASPSTQVISPFVHVNPATRYSIIVVIVIHQIPFTSSPLFQKF